MQEELDQLVKNDVWFLVPRPEDVNVIGVDFDETFALVARIESIRLLLAIACYLGLTLHQMDVKNAFLNGFIDEEAFVEQPWESILLVQIYVDDIIFGSTNKELCDKLSNLMQWKIEISMTGELTFFLGPQVNKLKDVTFISQTKYTRDLMKKFGMEAKSSVKIPMNTSVKMDMDADGKAIDQTRYRALIGSLLYLTASRPDITFVAGVCARFYSAPKESHMTAAKRILRYLKGCQGVGIWYPKDGRLS
ncbi:hypothetical protein DH2020_044148 [Rehmannia glutinosa]|uniref:Reverse transcriptase Ty1/copia-type domain-containing protein n=1 Tax=Rehmannia glutinosa TaxID=99300 RepID=A0ABR0UHT2_REHGL